MANELKFGNKVVFLNGLPLTLPVASSDPGSAAAGDLYYNSGSQVLRYYNGSAWATLATGGAAANTALSNLASTAVNVDLSPGADGTLNLGSLSDAWATVYANSIAKPSGNSIDLGNGYLKDSSGIIKLNWANGTLVDTSLNNQLTWGTTGITLNQLTATTVPYLNSSKVLTSSAVTPTELGYLSGVSSAIQTQLNAKQSTSLTTNHILVGAAGVATDVAMSGEASIVASGAVTLSNAAVIAKVLTAYSAAAGTVSATDSILAAIQKIDGNDALKIPLSQKGANSGVATLDSGGKIPLAQLPASLMEYQGTWNATTNTPTLADGTGTSGYFYRVQVAGTQDLGSGSQTFVVGDWVMYNGSIWQLAHAGADAVLSVNGSTGAVTVNAINQLTGEATAGPASGSQSVSVTLSNAAVIAKVLTGYTSGAGTVSATDSILAAIQKLNGNDGAFAVKALSNLASTAVNVDILPGSDKAVNLGSGSLRWTSVFAGSVDGGANTLNLKTTASNASIAMNANGTGTLDVAATKFRRSASGADTTNFVEDQYFDAITLAANVSSATEVSSSLSFALATWDSAIVEYKIKEATSNKVRVGQFIVTTDGTVASSSDQFTETAAVGSALGLSLSADVNSGNVRILFNNTNASNACIMRCNIRRIRT